jgi:hypothetical protein
MQFFEKRESGSKKERRKIYAATDFSDKYNFSLFKYSTIQAKIDFLKWYLSVNSSEMYGKFRVFRPKKIKKINFSLYL